MTVPASSFLFPALTVVSSVFLAPICMFFFLSCWAAFLKCPVTLGCGGIIKDGRLELINTWVLL